jgi:protein phosphatase
MASELLSSVFESLTANVRSRLDSSGSDPSSFILLPIDSESAREICSAAKSAFSADSMLLELNGDFLVVGDLHGHVLELFRILGEFGFPPDCRYVLLGDLVDRGEYSVHTALYVLLLKALFPNHFFVIRGNHECEDVNETRGLLTEIVETYENKDLFGLLNEVFEMMPIAARINGEFLCVHGGIGPGLKRLDQISGIERPLRDYDDSVVQSLLWSDPREGLAFRSSSRSLGFEFGEAPLCDFLEANKLKLLIRGHSAIPDGVLFGLDRKVVTVFSISNYCNERSGWAGVLGLAERKDPKPYFLPPLPYVFRKQDGGPLVPMNGRALSLAPAVPHSSSQPPKVVRLSGKRALHHAIRHPACIPRHVPSLSDTAIIAGHARQNWH